MLYINKNQFVESGEIQTILEESVIQVRRNITRVSNGEKETKLAPSQKVIKVVRKLLNVIVSTGINELCGPKSQFTDLLQCDGKHTNDYIKNYFKGYGIGEYSFSNKYNITISGESKSIKRETHYYMYINKETLELMRDTMNIEGVDWDALIAQIPECERKCNIIGNKTQTEINIMNYIDSEFIMNYRINVEKNLFTKEGHYSKETNIINTNDNSVVELSKKENDFTPKAVVEEQVEELVEDYEVVFDAQEEEEETVEEVEDYEPAEIVFSVSKKTERPVRRFRDVSSLLSGNKVVVEEPVIDEPVFEEEVVETVVEEQQESALDRMARFSARINASFEGRQVNNTEWEYEEEEEELDPIEEQRQAWWNK